MKIAVYNGETYHNEMFGYIINYCKTKNHKLTVYCKSNKKVATFSSDNSYIELYKTLFLGYPVEFKELHEFTDEKYGFDMIILVTDDDASFNTDDITINNKTIRIDHYYKVRRPLIKKCIATRPFSRDYYRNFAIPCYPIISNRIQKEEDSINIAIVGCANPYSGKLINRLSSHKKINLLLMGKAILPNCFDEISNKFNINVYENIESIEMLKIINASHYVMTDYKDSRDRGDEHEHNIMSGSIPLSFSMLVPLIISKQTNQFYKFDNVIEFDKYTNDEILLTPIDLNKLKKNRDEIIEKNNKLFDMYSKAIEFYHKWGEP